MCMCNSKYLLLLIVALEITTQISFLASGFLVQQHHHYRNHFQQRQQKQQQQQQQQQHSFLSSSKEDTNNNDLLSINRLPTSVDDQIRQATIALQQSTNNGKIYRHCIRLLLPIIGATELDDWPGGSRQQMEAAYPLVQSILSNTILYNQQQKNNSTTSTTNNNVKIQTIIIDNSDGVAAMYVESPYSSKDDSCTIVLPTAETIVETIQTKIEQQVTKNRNLIFINPQWKRRTDFSISTSTSKNGGNLFRNMFGNNDNNNNDNNNNDKQQNPIDYVESYHPTFSLTNIIVEGEIIRILRTYPGPWRVYQQINLLQNDKDINDGTTASTKTKKTEDTIDWILIGETPVITTKPNDWDTLSYNKQDGGLLFTYGQPSYNDIATMIRTNPNYIPKNTAQRAASAFQFIKDSF